MNLHTALRTLILAALLTIPGSLDAAPQGKKKPLSAKRGYALVDDLFSEDKVKRGKARDKLIRSGDLSLAPAVMEAVFFSTAGAREAAEVLDRWFDVDYGVDYKRWVARIGSLETPPKKGYLAYKAKLFGWIDPAFAAFLSPKHQRTIRPEEIIWGGVKKDGIPALFGPPFIPAAEADYMTAKEPVFGVSINGDTRAYPFRILDWHEMANDIVGGVPVSLAYCTMCGAGILYDTRKTGGGHFTFGSSGLLYRSNKLMYDHQTNTLWNHMTGEPSMGPLTGKDVRLKALPLTVTTWGDWLKRHPDTKVISRQTGYQRRYTPGAAYGDYFSSPDLRFPVWNKPSNEPGLADKDWMWVVIADGARKAFVLNRLMDQRLHLARIGEADAAIFADPSSGAVRAYRTDGRKLALEDGRIVDESGTGFTMTEDALFGQDGQSRFDRLPGHRTYWFSWGSFFEDEPYEK